MPDGSNYISLGFTEVFDFLAATKATLLTSADYLLTTKYV